MSQEFTLVDRIICAAAQAWKNDGEVLATGIGVVPRLAASLCMKSVNTDLMMTDSEAWLLSEPVPLTTGPMDNLPREGWMGFTRIFDNVWSGKRHAMVGPTQIDQYGQANISMIGDDYNKPKVQMLGARGFPGNSISHANSFFVPNHSKNVFVSKDEVDMVSSIGYNAKRLPRGYSVDDVQIRFVFTNLCVMDFGGKNHQLRLLALHPGVTAEQVQEATGFAIEIPANVGVTPDPTPEQIALLNHFDPKNFRAKALG